MKTNGQWKIKFSQEKFKNDYFRVREDQVIRPDGKDGTYAVVELRSGASVLPVDEDGSVYLINQHRYTIEQDSVEVAGGGINDHETPLDAAKREMREELGLEAEEWISLGLLNPFTTAIKSPHHIFLAKKLKSVVATPDPTENGKPMKVRLDKAVSMVMDGTITNGPSCVLILKAERYLKK